MEAYTILALIVFMLGASGFIGSAFIRTGFLFLKKGNNIAFCICSVCGAGFFLTFAIIIFSIIEHY